MDLSKLDTVKASNNGAELEILHPVTQEPTGAIFLLLGSDSDAYREELERQREALIRKRNLRANLTREERDERELALLTSCVVGWRNVQDQGAEVEFSKEAARRFLTAYPWLRSQVDSAIHDYSLFLTK